MNTQYMIQTIGVAVCIISAFVMFDGTLLGEQTTGLATLAGIIGISISSTSTRTHRGR